jgi:hypothetical protein
VFFGPDLPKAGVPGHHRQLHDVNKMEAICSAPAKTLDEYAYTRPSQLTLTRTRLNSHIRIAMAAQAMVAHIAMFEIFVQPVHFQLDVLRRSAQLE